MTLYDTNGAGGGNRRGLQCGGSRRWPAPLHLSAGHRSEAYLHRLQGLCSPQGASLCSRPQSQLYTCCSPDSLKGPAKLQCTEQKRSGARRELSSTSDAAVRSAHSPGVNVRCGLAGLTSGIEDDLGCLLPAQPQQQALMQQGVNIVHDSCQAADMQLGGGPSPMTLLVC